MLPITLLALLVASTLAAPKRPNIVLILADDQDARQDSVSTMKNVQELLVEEGTQFKHFYAPISVCCPSRTSLLRAQAAHNTNITSVVAPWGGWEVFNEKGYNGHYLPSFLQEAGYDTYYVGKLMNAHAVSNIDTLPALGWTDSDFLVDPQTYNYWNASFVKNAGPVVYHAGEYSTDLVHSKGLAALDLAAQNPDTPFFVGIAPIGPHTHITGARNAKGEILFDLPQSAGRHSHLFTNVTLDYSRASHNPERPSGVSWIRELERLNRTQVDYIEEFYRARLRALQAVDELVEGVVRKLEEMGELENTFIVYTSDNGFEANGGHRRQPGKTLPYEEDINIPFVVRGPSVPAGLVDTSSVYSLADLGATILHLAGAKTSYIHDGSLVPFTQEMREGLGDEGAKQFHLAEYWVEGIEEGKYGGAFLFFWMRVGLERVVRAFFFRQLLEGRAYVPGQVNTPTCEDDPKSRSSMRSISRSPSPADGIVRKRDRSPSAESTQSLKRSHSEDPTTSDQEGSLGASRLNLMDTQQQSSGPSSPLTNFVLDETSPSTLSCPSPNTADEDAPPAYNSNSELFTTAAPSVTPPDGAAQVEIIKELNRHDLTAGDSWWLVSRTWYRRWAAAASGEALSKGDELLDLEAVGPIDNSSITTTDGQLKQPVLAGVDVELLPAQAYGLLSSWYGTTGAVFERSVVGNFGSERVEFYPPTFSIFHLLPSETTSSVSIPTEPQSPPRLSLSSGETVTELRTQASASLNLTRQTRLWRLADSSVTDLDTPAFVFADKVKEEGAELVDPTDSQATIDEALLNEPHVRIAVEQMSALGNWIVDAEAIAVAKAAAPPPSPAAVPKKSLFGGGFFNTMEKTNSLTPKYKDKENGKAVAGSSGSGSNSLFGNIAGALTRSKSNTRGAQRGLTGLSNLGNTCFMNSALQCMSNTKELQEYFTSGVYKSEINRDNPLGMNGQVAEAFGQLIERLWSSSSSSYAPREFKQALSKFAPSFSGYGQQDSQELLAFLLDGTHEDLNRIKKKPIVTSPDWEGGGDAELIKMAETCWEQYRSRNDSVIVDLFQGQYRSTVVCPDCGKVSITFDPFMYVTTNIPNTKKWQGKVYLVPADTTRPRYSIELELPKSATIKTMKQAIGSFQNIDPRRLIVAEEWKGKFWKTWYDDEMASEVTDNDNLIFYEVGGPLPQPKPRTYGKTKPKVIIDPDAPIVIAVQHTVVAKKKAGRSAFGSRKDDEPEVFGTPFVVSLTREEASSQQGIYRALARQYARVSKRGEDLIETADDFDFSPPAPALEELADLPPSTSAAATTSLPDTPPPETNDIVVDTPITEFSSTDSTSPSEAATTSTLPSTPAFVPKPLFTVHVSKVSLPNARLPFDNKHWGGYNATILLEERAKNVATAAAISTELPPSQPSTPGPSTPTADTEDVDMASPIPASTEPTPETAPLPTLHPIVRTGDYFVVDWDPAALEMYFGGDGLTGEHALWNHLEAFVDPALIETRSRKGQKKTSTIEGCLTEFTKEERLGEDDMWYCPSCKGHKQATKKVDIWKVPDVLVFALKRFGEGRYSRDKIDEFVDFPIEGFNMEPFVQGDKVERRVLEASGVTLGEPESLIYDLYAVDNHYGGLGGGHYTAYAKNPETDKWYDFDDSRVSPISDPASKIKTSAAYLLFYRRRTTRPIGAKSRQLVDSAIQSRNASASNSDAGASRPPSPGPSSLSTSTYTAIDDSFPSGDSDDDRFGRNDRGMYPSYNESQDDLQMSLGSTANVSPVFSDTEADAGSPIEWNSAEEDAPTVDVTLENHSETETQV
ncbi:hypothetical protein P7C70_g972, partial [Phenoliferia sp. Uapishka_3]